MKRVLALSFSVALACTAAHAKPQSLDDAKSESKKLEQASSELKKETLGLQKDAVEAAETVQKRERQLLASELKLKAFKAQRAEKEKAVSDGKARLSRYTHTMLRLSALPPEAMVLLPEVGDSQVEAASAMSLMTESIKQQTMRLQAHVDALKAAEKGLKDESETTRALLEKQKDAHAELTQTLKERERAYAANEEKRKSLNETIKKMAKESKSTKELIGKINAADSAKPAEKMDKDKKNLRAFEKAKGKIRPPAAGRIIKKFGESTPRGDKGMVIETRKGATVTAPFDGEVVFAGAFLNYGNMVIIRHRGDYHSLISGMSDIHTHVGEFLLEGEPIGAMENEDSDPQLYFELRFGNQSIDPSPWISR